ncbi:PRP1 splicing factor, N-terminal domain containing protein [Amanita muscaria]
MATKDNSNKHAFLSMPAPASYVAGLGRGASGFTTRSDIGPAREGPSAEVIAEAQMRRGEEPDYDPDAYQDPENETGLFAGTVYEADDEEADNIYAQVDEEMDKRRKNRRETRESVEAAKFRAERPKIQQQFADLKRGLSSVTDEEWESLPEVGNLTKRRKVRETRFFVVPDSVIVGDRDKISYESSISKEQQQLGVDGTATSLLVGETTTDFVELGNARDKVLSLKLDQASSSASGFSTSINPKDYLTDLNSVVLKSEAEIGDIKRARMLFDSLTKSNPKHAPGWIAAARVEEHAGRMVAARKLIMKGCEECPRNEDVWLEAARLHNENDAKVILAKAVQHVDPGKSLKIWLQAANLEHDVTAKKRVLRKALEVIPNSARLWKVLVNLETLPNDARVLLSRAVEIIPHSVELWLALARLGNSQHAKAVLNKARKAIPTSHEIWIAAAQLLEQELQDAAKGISEDAAAAAAPTTTTTLDVIDKTIELGVRELRKHGVLFTRDQWLSEAEKCDEGGKPRTCEAIIKATIAMEIEEEEDRYDMWLSDVESMESKGRIATARAILAYALKVFPNRVKLWERAAYLEASHGTGESREALLQRAVEHCPQAEVLWLMWAKKKWEDRDVSASREVLEKAFLANPESEAIWLAAVKLEAENGQYDVARALLTRARLVAGTPRIWMKSAVFERNQDRLDDALTLISDALQKFAKFAKLYMIQGQIHQSRKRHAQARASFAAGLKAVPDEPVLWILASRLEEEEGKSIKSRALLDKARVIMPNNEEIWAEAVRVEDRASGSQSSVQSKSVLSRAIQACPTSGLLWSMLVWSEPRPTRKARATDAMTKTGKHPLVLCTVARLFWQERKVEKARDWFDRAAKAASADEYDSGDIWAWWYRFEKEQGTKEYRKDVVDKCVVANPRHGQVWQAVAKDPKNTGKSTVEILELVVEVLS